MTGSMSIGINLLTAPQEELDELKKAIAEFKRLRGDLQDAYVYRIASATQHPYALFQYVRRDRKAFTLFCLRPRNALLGSAHAPVPYAGPAPRRGLRLRGWPPHDRRGADEHRRGGIA